MAYFISPFYRLNVLAVIVILTLSACAGAPVQEMSNARQAIRAARDAGAENVAAQEFTEARALLERAEASLQSREYRDARRNAVAARGKAVRALEAAQTTARKGAG
jgi:sialic acid synthase SpsE